MENKVLIETIIDHEPEIGLLPSCKLDGANKQLLTEKILEDGSEEKCHHIFGNAYKVMKFMVDPQYDGRKSTKILCLGKVQSGKTAFFIASIALAFDNGYNLVFVIGGTKNKLKAQNLERLQLDFDNNNLIRIINLSYASTDIISKEINKGKKVIVVVLKNVTSDDANLSSVEQIAREYSAIPTLIIDDEGDEGTPGAPRLKGKNSKAGKTHDVFDEILSTFDKVTYLSVTATPQASFLLSKIDALSPDYAVMVEPGPGYTGGNAYHDVESNYHVVEINDTDDFMSSIPESFTMALKFFILMIGVHRSRRSTKPYSMLIHPSSLNIVQTMVVEKIREYFEYVVSILKFEKHISYPSLVNEFSEMLKTFNDTTGNRDDISSVLSEIRQSLKLINIYEINISSTGKTSTQESEMDKDHLYKIFVGGNILGRGLTIENLITTYIYRDSKVSAIDTLFQRARWFGYKQEYFDTCRVFMTRDLKRKFITMVDHENDMWNALDSFLSCETNIKEFPRIFQLSDERLILTRKSVSRTIVVNRTNPGFNYDKSIWYNPNEIILNQNIYTNFMNKYQKYGTEVPFGNSPYQIHYVITMKYTDFYIDFLNMFIFPRGSRLGNLSFARIYDDVNNKVTENLVSVIVMRYKYKEFRSTTKDGLAIKELPQGYDLGTLYPGDKDLSDFSKVLHIQIHLVYTDKSELEHYIPTLALNNPISTQNVRYVTGDYYYETI